MPQQKCQTQFYTGSRWRAKSDCYFKREAGLSQGSLYDELQEMEIILRTENLFVYRNISPAGFMQGVMKGRCGLGFVDESFSGVGVSGELRREKLQCNGALELGVFGFVDNASATKTADPQNGNHSQRAFVGRFGTCHLRRTFRESCNVKSLFQSLCFPVGA